MKRVYVNEQWCLGCHLCEYNCAFANSGEKDTPSPKGTGAGIPHENIWGMVRALKGKTIYPRIHIEGEDQITYAVSCRHCTDPLCVWGCISGALHLSAPSGTVADIPRENMRGMEDGVICIDHAKCVGCLTCVMLCPYGAVAPGQDGAALKCELCLQNTCGEPACAAGCPNRAIVYEERKEASA